MGGLSTSDQAVPATAFIGRPDSIRSMGAEPGELRARPLWNGVGRWMMLNLVLSDTAEHLARNSAGASMQALRVFIWLNQAQSRKQTCWNAKFGYLRYALLEDMDYGLKIGFEIPCSQM